MSAELKAILKDAKASLKSDLKEGEELLHVSLGRVVYTDICAEVERRDGFDITSVHLEHDGECKEVSLGMIRRKRPDGRIIRMQADTPELQAAIAAAEEFLTQTEYVKSAAPMVKAILAAAPNLHG